MRVEYASAFTQDFSEYGGEHFGSEIESAKLQRCPLRLRSNRLFSSWATKASVSLLLAILATGLSVAPILILTKPNSTNSASGSTIQQLTFGNWNDVQPRSSSTGLIVYSSNKTGSYQIYTMLRSGNHQTQITSVKGYAYDPEFSPNGDIISYIWSHNEYADLCFVTMSSQESDSSICGTNNSHVGMHYSWSGDSNVIAYDNGTRIYLHYIDDNKTTGFSFAGSAYDPEFCGASLLCFAGSTAQHNETAIWISDLNGNNLTRLSWTGSEYFPQFNPVTNMVLYLANYTGHPEAWFVRTNGMFDNALFQIVPSINDYYMPPILPKISPTSPPAWNPTSGQVLVTGTMDDNLTHFVIVNTTFVPLIVSGVTYSVTAFSVLKTAASSVSQAEWGPNGQVIIYVSKSTDGFQKIFLLNLANARLSSAYGS